MNSLDDDTEPTETENLSSGVTGVELEPDDEFENEELGERQVEACLIDDDNCLSCPSARFTVSVLAPVRTCRFLHEEPFWAMGYFAQG